MKILVANIGSTSLKWQLFDFSNGNEHLLHKGGFERVTDYSKAIDDCLAQLHDAYVLTSEKDLAAVGFKTVIAKNITGCVRIDKRVLQAMSDFTGLAPAHNPPYINGIKLFSERMPNVPLIALFETAFYKFAPEASMRYAVPDSWYQIGIRRWGFHGASHKFIAERSAELLEREDVAARARQLYVNGVYPDIDGEPLRVISCHLGGSSSVTGIKNGVAIGTSMGLSPQSGLPQNNRVGDLDSEAVPYAVKTLGISIEEAQRQLTEESGLKGLSGGYNDVRDILPRYKAGDAKAKLAVDILVASARHWIGSFFLQLNGADALVFTAGIGENRWLIREKICEGLDKLGIRLDKNLNEHLEKAKHGQDFFFIEKKNKEKEEKKGKEGKDLPVKIIVITANEGLVVARETKRFLENHKN